VPWILLDSIRKYHLSGRILGVHSGRIWRVKKEKRGVWFALRSLSLYGRMVTMTLSRFLLGDHRYYCQWKHGGRNAPMVFNILSPWLQVLGEPSWCFATLDSADPANLDLVRSSMLTVSVSLHLRHRDSTDSTVSSPPPFAQAAVKGGQPSEFFSNRASRTFLVCASGSDVSLPFGLSDSESARCVS